MREKGESAGDRSTGAVWPRLALVSLWLLVFALAGSFLAARWDLVMARLAGPPVAEGALR